MNTRSWKPREKILAGFLAVAVLFSCAPVSFAAQGGEYQDPAKHWVESSNRTIALDINAVVRQETFFCTACHVLAGFTIFRTAEYTISGETAWNRGVLYSDGTCSGGVTSGNLDSGVPGKNATYTGYHWSKSICNSCGTINGNLSPDDYGHGNNVYRLNDCARDFFEVLDETQEYKYVDHTSHQILVTGGNYCGLCHGTHHTISSSLENHQMERKIVPQPANQRFLVTDTCSLCGYTEPSYVAAKSVIANYYGVVDGQAHTLTVTDLSEAGVQTQIRYGNAANDCTLTTAPSYTEEGQETVYYEITYTYNNTQMVENGVGYVWLRDESGTTGSSGSGGTGGSGTCGCGCQDKDCGCKSDCNGNTCSGSCSNKDNHPHNFVLLDSIKPTCLELGYDRYLCPDCGRIEKRDYTAALGHAYQNVVVREPTCEVEGKQLDICSRCGDVQVILTPKGDHKYQPFDVAATCTQPGLTGKECTICGDRHVLQVTDALPHNYEPIVTEATCESSGQILHRCSGCGSSFTTDYQDALGHAWDEGTVLQDATCVDDGVMQYQCTRCGIYRLENVPNSVHNNLCVTFAAASPIGKAVSAASTSKAAATGGHMPGPPATCTTPQTCVACGVILAESTGHHFWQSTVPATCTTMGYTTATCIDCGTTQQSNHTDALGHNYMAEVKAPTCLEKGYTTYTCSRCGESHTSDYREALGHTWDKGTQVTSSTCNGASMKEYHCTRCDASYLESGSVAGHKPGPDATCTDPQICTVCGAVLAYAKGHHFTETKKEPTCTESGSITHVCRDCDQRYVSDYVDPLQHNYQANVVAPTCLGGGYTTYSCTRCSHTYISDRVSPLGHQWNDGKVVSTSTCNGTGVLEYQCVRCDQIRLETNAATGHTPGPDATCTDPQTCTACGAILKNAKGHHYEVDTKDPTCTEVGYTTYRCTTCGIKGNINPVSPLGHNYKPEVKAPTCLEGGYTTYTCDRCGDHYTADKTEPTGHKWDQGHMIASPTCNGAGVTEYHCVHCDQIRLEASSATGHTPGAAATCTEPQLCTVCGAVLANTVGHDYESVVQEPTCTEMGYTTYTCKRCGQKGNIDPIDALGHAYQQEVKAPTCLEDGFTTYTCERCGNRYTGDPTKATGHQWEEGKTVTSPTCNGAGVTEYHCIHCDQIRLEANSATGHTPGAEATCTKPQLCTVCGAVLVNECGHNYESVVKEPTCTEMGYTTYTCKRCGQTGNMNPVDALGHAYQQEVKAPTCLEDGFTTYTCDRCGNRYTDDPIQATGHQWDEGKAVTGPTCNGAGVTEYHCIHCDQIRLEANSATGHTPGPEATCDTPQLCTVCGAVLANMVGHDYESVVKEPTCTEMGYTKYTCKRCGQTGSIDPIDPLGHAYQKAVKAPTCLEDGFTTYTCERCGHSYASDPTKATGHQWDEGTAISNPTCNGAGVVEHRCVQCGEHLLKATSAEGHTPGQEATCTEAQLCTVCGAVLVHETGHDFESVVKEPTCTEMGYTTYTCKRCGQTGNVNPVNAIGHTYQPEIHAPTCLEDGFTMYTCDRCGDSYTADPTEATGHQWDEGKAISNPTCNGAGVVEYRCVQCGERLLEASSAEGHTPGSEATCTEPQLCTVCGAVLVNAAGHDYESVVKEPTCTEMGYTTYTCKRCGQTGNVNPVDAIGHDYQPEIHAPTCLEGGYTTYTCAHCGDSYTADRTEAAGHQWDKGTAISNPTCNGTGVVEYRCVQCGEHLLKATSAEGHTPGSEATCDTPQLCTVCGAVLINAFGHDYETVVTAPTCLESGFTTYTCTRCGVSAQVDATDPLGHHYIPETTAPTCLEGGFTTHTCDRCGDSYTTDPVEALGHEWDEGTTITSPTCNGAGVIDYRCVRCDYHHLEAESMEGHTPGEEATCTQPQLCTVCGAVLVNALEHDYQTVVTPSTCLESGFTTYTCTRCGASAQVDATDPLGHNYIPETTAPTCLEGGYTTHTCDRCGDSYITDYVDALGHAWDDGTIVTSPTCGGEGVTDYRCVRCDYHHLEAKSIEGHTPGEEATCTQPQLCTVCGAVLVNALEHDYQAVVTPSTCLESGFTTYTCTRCGASANVDFTDPLGHNYVPEVTEPTCLEAGFTTYTCANCGDSYVTEHVDALGHEWDEGTVISSPTCNGDGVTDYHCVRCDYHHLEAISMEGHTPGEAATCEMPQLCTVCGAVLENALGHEYETAVTAPTCLDMGFTTYTCTRCPDSYKSDYQNALGHQPGEWIVDLVPTVSAAGSRHQACTVCGTTLLTESLEKLYRIATTDTYGEAVVGTYLVIVTDTNTTNPVFGAVVTQNEDQTFSIRLPDTRLLNYAAQTTVTVLKKEDKSAVASVKVSLTDKNGNFCAEFTDPAGRLTVPAGDSAANHEGKTTIGSADTTGVGRTITVQVVQTDTGRPVENAKISTNSMGTIFVKLPDGMDFNDQNRVTVTVADQNKVPQSNRTVLVQGDLGQTIQGQTNKDGFVTLPVTTRAYTEPSGTAIVGRYTVLVSYVSGQAVDHALVTLKVQEDEDTFTIRLPDGNLLDSKDQIMVTLLLPDGSPAPDRYVRVEDSQENYAGKRTNANGQILVPDTASSSGDIIGTHTNPGTDKEDSNTINVEVQDKDGNPIENAERKVNLDGSVSIRLPDTFLFEKDGSVTVILTDNQGHAKSDLHVDLEDGDGKTASGLTDSHGKVTMPKTYHAAYLFGYIDGTIGPQRNMTRSEAAAIFARILSEARNDNMNVYSTRFTDVNADMWYYKDVAYLDKMGIVEGRGDGLFYGNDNMTRNEFVTMCVRLEDLMELQKRENNRASFPDVVSGHWATPYVQYAARNGWVIGSSDNLFHGENQITRAEVVTIVNRMLGRSADEAFIRQNEKNLNTFYDLKDPHYWAYFDMMEAANSHSTVSGTEIETWHEAE